MFVASFFLAVCGAYYITKKSAGFAYSQIEKLYSYLKLRKQNPYPHVDAEYFQTKNNSFFFLQRTSNEHELDISISAKCCNDDVIEIPVLISELDGFLILPPFTPEKCNFKEVIVIISDKSDREMTINWNIDHKLSLEKIIKLYEKEHCTLAEAYDE